MRRPRGHGGAPDPPDDGDLVHPKSPRPEKTRVDLSTWKSMPKVWDQKGRNSCVPHAVAAAWMFTARRWGGPAVSPSRLFIWYEGRARQNLGSNDDKGIYIRTALKVLFDQGAPPERAWPYRVTKFAKHPPPEAYAAAAQHKVQNYFTVKPGKTESLLERLKAVLSDGYPICFPFRHTAEFDSPEVEASGVLPMLNADEPLVGEGHAGLLVGYDDSTSLFKVRNSYGPEWGQQGYFTMPYEYVLSPWAGPEFWTVHIAGGH